MWRIVTDRGHERLDRAAWPLAALSGLAVAVSNASGLAISDDGVAYRAVAESVNERGVLGYFLEPRLTTWPPVWPRAMAFIDRITPLDARGAAIALNVISAAVAVLLFAMAIRTLMSSATRRVAAITAFALGSTQILFGHILNTDYAMTVMFLALFVVLGRYRTAPRMRWVLIAALVVWVGFGIRYASLAAIPIVAVWLAIVPGFPLPSQLGRSAVFVVSASAFPVGVMLRNHSVDGTWLGVRSESARGLPGNTFDAVASVGNFLAPGVAIDLRTVWAAAALIAGALVATAGLRLVIRSGTLSSVHRARAALASPLGFALLWAGGFGAYLIIARSTTAFDRLNFRLVHPLWCPLVIVGLVVADRLCDPRFESEQRWRLLGSTLLWGWVVVSTTLGVVMTAWFATGPDLFPGNYERAAFDEVRSSPLVDDLDPECIVHSNLPSALYPDIESAWTPRTRLPESTEQLDELDDLAADPSTDYCIVWVDLEPTFGNLAPLEEIRALVPLETVGVDGAVAVYRVAPS